MKNNKKSIAIIPSDILLYHRSLSLDLDIAYASDLDFELDWNNSFRLFLDDIIEVIKKAK